MPTSGGPTSARSSGPRDGIGVVNPAPDERPEAVRVDGSGRRPRGPQSVIAIAIIFLVLALAKPWGSRRGRATGLDRRWSRRRRRSTIAVASPSPTSAWPWDPNATSCLGPDGLVLVTLVRWPGHEVRTWQPATAALSEEQAAVATDPDRRPLLACRGARHLPHRDAERRGLDRRRPDRGRGPARCRRAARCAARTSGRRAGSPSTSRTRTSASCSDPRQRTRARPDADGRTVLLLAGARVRQPSIAGPGGHGAEHRRRRIPALGTGLVCAWGSSSRAAARRRSCGSR